MSPITFPLPPPWRVLATGFGAFGTHAWNPSRIIASELAALRPDQVSYEELPVTFESACAWIRPDDPHTLIVHFGLAAQAKEVRIEARAQNATGSAPDNAGVVAEGVVAEGGADELRIGFDVEPLIERLREFGPGFVLPSEDAGTYVCNATLYHSLLQAPARSVFIHVPPMDEAACARWAQACALALFGGPARANV
jgi:pyrrolidone-carboxylate peptidase